MDYAKITNFATKDTLPSGNSGKIVKGTEIDDEFNAISSAIASKANLGSPAFTGTPTAPTATAGSNTAQLATTAFVTAAVGALVTIPPGLISLWSGSIVSIPSDWYLCNGSNGTPDLRDRFVVGAGTTYAVGATGGANTVTLDATMIPAHTHTLTATGTSGAQSNDHSHTFSGTTSGQSATHSHAVNDPGHQHGNGDSLEAAYGNGSMVPSGKSSSTYFSQTAVTGITLGNASADHSHTYSGTTSGISANHTHSVTVTGTTGNGTGGGLAHENRPPYYALAYIMKA